MIGELFAEIAHEITAEPMRFAVEVIQFVLLLLIVKAVALGFGKRKGFVTNILAERRNRIEARIEAASHSAERLADARRQAEERISVARGSAAHILLDARAEGRQVVQTALSQAAAETEAAQKRAQETLDTELEEMHVEVRDKLVDLVAGATRSILSETHTPSEQRALIQKAISQGLDRMDAEVASAPTKSRRARAVRPS